MIHLPGFARALRFGRFVIFAILFFGFCALVASAQETPKGKPAAQHKQIQRRQASAQKPRTEQDPVEQHYRAAETFQLAGDMQSAEAEYRQVLSLGLQQLAAIRVLAQDNPQALVLLKSAVAANPSDLEAQLSLASVYLRTGDLPNAKPLLSSILAKDVHRLAAKSLLGQVLFMEGDYTAAAEQFQSVMTEDPGLEVAYSLAITYLKLGKLANATNVFDEMLTSLGSSAELHVLIGRAYRDGNQLDLAAGEFRKALSMNPAVPRAHSYLGFLYLLQGGDAALADARKEFEAEISHDPNDYSSHFYLGVILFKRREFGLAEQELAKAIHLQPDSPDAYFYRGQVQLESGNSHESVPQFERAVQLYGNASKASQPAHAALAKALASLGKHAEAGRESEIAKELGQPDSQAESDGLLRKPDEVKEMQAILALPAQDAASQKIPAEYLAGLREALGNAYHNLGVIHAQRSRYAEAAGLFAEAAKWSPSIKSLDRNWGLASFRANQYQMAIEPLEREMHAAPGDSNVRQMLALSYFMTENFTNAAEAFRPILTALSDNPSLLYAAGVSLAKSGDSNGAGEIFRRMLAQHPDAAEVHLFLGQAHADRKEESDAFNEFSRALELNPKLPEANYGLGMLHLRQGNMEQAEKDFRAELAVNPLGVSAEYRLGYVLLAQRKQVEAIELLADVVRQKPNDGEAQYELGKALLEKGDLKPATERLETAVRLEPKQPYAYYQLSLAYRRQGRAQEAEATLQQYEKLKQKKPQAGNENNTNKPR